MALKSIIKDQIIAIKLFYQDVRFRSPMLTIWVASFGSSIHDPVTTYFYLELGATAEQIGLIGSIATIGSLVLAPLYGYVQDSHNAYPAMCVSCFFCAFGCLVRGFATGIGTLYIGALILGLGVNLWPLVLSHVASSVPPSKRAIVVSGYLGQEKFLRLLGRAVYPPLDWLLGVPLGLTDTLLRYRVVMSICTAFCFFGFVLFLKDKDGIAQSPRPSPAGEKLPSSSATASHHVTGDPADQPSNATQARPPGNQSGTNTNHAGTDAPQSSARSWWARNKASKWFLPSVCLSGALVAQNMAMTMGNVLWPIYLRDSFGLGPSAFAWIVLAKALASIAAVWAFPSAETLLGRHRVPQHALLLAAAACWCGFLDEPGAALWSLGSGAQVAVSNGTALDTGGQQGPGGQVGLQVLFFALTAMVEPSLKSLATLAVPPNLQGRSWAALTVLQGVGGIIGYSLGTKLYATESARSFASPYVAVTLTLVGASFLVLLAECAAKVAGCPTATSDVKIRSRENNIDSEVKGRRHL